MAILSLVWVVRVSVLVVISMGDVREEPREHTELTCAERSVKDSPILRVRGVLCASVFINAVCVYLFVCVCDGQRGRVL